MEYYRFSKEKAQVWLNSMEGIEDDRITKKVSKEARRGKTCRKATVKMDGYFT